MRKILGSRSLGSGNLKIWDKGVKSMNKCLFIIAFGWVLSGCVTTQLGEREYYTDQDLISGGAQQLRGNDIVGVVSGNTLYGRYVEQSSNEEKEPKNDRKWVEFISGDGRVAYYDFKQLIQGNWQLKTDLICFEYKMQIPQPENCFVVYALDDKHYFISIRQQTMGQVVSVILGRKNGNAAGLDLK
ncbi:hypothetical protein [Kiloniella antarctica]|uniref:Lipoprotein n=1 Tax=Kiloniella antarctica TaxID=1550907 RepID=A0ABW5BR53_9PROT